MKSYPYECAALDESRAQHFGSIARGLELFKQSAEYRRRLEEKIQLHNILVVNGNDPASVEFRRARLDALAAELELSAIQNGTATAFEGLIKLPRPTEFRSWMG